MNFPSRHPLNHSFRRNVVVGQADVILAIEINDHWAALNAFHDRIVRTSQPLYKPTTKIITLGLRDMYLKANFQDFGRFDDIDLAVAGDGEASLPALTEAVRRLDRRRPQIRFRGARQALCGGAARHAGAGQIRCHGRLGCEPDHHRAAVRRGLRADQGRRLVAGRQHHRQCLAAPLMEIRQAAPVDRPLRRCRRRLQCPGFARRGARQQAPWPADGRRSTATAT